MTSDVSAIFLSVDGVSRRFGGLVAVNDVSFSVSQGELVSIIGPNGAGKTTLFNLLTGQLRPSSGRITFRGQDISALPPQRRARLGFGRTFQISQTLTSLSVLENAMVGAFLKHKHIADAAERAFAALKLTGLATKASQLGGSLTLSERRRLEVARAVAMEPSVLLLDEVMAGLNPTEVSDITDLVQQLNAQRFTILVIEHNLKVVRLFARRVIVLDRGALIAQGTAEEVLSDPTVVSAYVGRRRA